MNLGDIRIYNKNFELISIIPKFIASNWELKFCGYGCGEIEFERDDDIVPLLYENEYLFLVQDGIQSIVTGYKIGKSCTVFTRTLEWMLTKFIVKKVVVGENLSETVENILSSLPEAFGLEFYGIDDTFDMSDCAFSKAIDLYTAIVECIADKKIGFSFTVDFSNKKFAFSLLGANENKDILLCDEYRTSYDTEYTHHIQEKATGGCYYHDVTYKGKWNPSTNSPNLTETPENCGKYYKVSASGSRFDLTLVKDDIVLCDNTDGTWKKVLEAKPFLVEIAPEDEGVFSWSTLLPAENGEEAKRLLKEKKSVDLLASKTKLLYNKDYRLGDIIKTKFYGRDKSFSVKKLVSEVHLWTERGESGESPVMKDLKEEENGV